MRTPSELDRRRKQPELQRFALPAVNLHVRCGTFESMVLVLTTFIHDRYANMTLGQPCILDDVTYIDMGPNGEQFSNTVTRHNCQTPQFYCDASVKACVPTKTLGTSCITDQECQSVRLSIMTVQGLFANVVCISVQLRS